MPGAAGAGAGAATAGGAHGQALGGAGGGGGGAAGGGNGAASGAGVAQREGGAGGGGGGGGMYMQHPAAPGGGAAAAGQRAMQDGMPYPATDLLSTVGNNKGATNMASQRLNTGQLAMDGAGASPTPFGGGGGGGGGGNDHGLGGGGAAAGNGGVSGLGAGLGGGAPGGHSSLSFDMKEFPALGSGMANLNLGGGDEGYSRQAYRGEPQGFSMQSDDFPALPVAAPSAAGPTGSSALGGATFHPPTAAEGMGAGALRGAPGQPRPMGPGVAGGPTAAAVVAASEGKAKKYGLLGLLGVIRMTDPDLNTLALGSDLTTVGLNLDSAEVLYASFASPWAEEPATPEPQFTLPSCYYLQPPPLKPMHLKNFQLETLFYIFYSMPQDAYAAQELHAREWRFQSVLKLWFKRVGPADGNVPPNVEYIYFDHNEWQRQFFAGNVQMIQVSNGLLTEEDIRIK
ncbi:unnamed protein product [Ectocarpus sp. CCAP 1310/34]|nr:unnamed protein product [Ectocarpus sp. CCAP 1310/34]